MNARRASSPWDTSYSDQWGTRSPVSAWITTVGEPGSSEAGMVTGVGNPVAVPPGKWAMSVDAGEKPSEVLKVSVVTVTLPLGIMASVMASRRPVGVSASSRENTLLGYGKPQCVGTSGSQSRVGQVPSHASPSPSPVSSPPRSRPTGWPGSHLRPACRSPANCRNSRQPRACRPGPAAAVEVRGHGAIEATSGTWHLAPPGPGGRALDGGHAPRRAVLARHVGGRTWRWRAGPRAAAARLRAAASRSSRRPISRCRPWPRRVPPARTWSRRRAWP